jgi:hypothetical protein
MIHPYQVQDAAVRTRVRDHGLLLFNLSLFVIFIGCTVLTGS